MSVRSPLELMDREERRRRTLYRSWQLDPYLKGIMQMADEAGERGESITCVLDTEGDQVNFDSARRKRHVNCDGKVVSGDPFYHHRLALLRSGLSEEEVRERERATKVIANNWKRKKPWEKIRDHYEAQAKRIGSGLLLSDCHVIQVTVLEDKENKFPFILQATRLTETEYEGENRLPPAFESFLTHPHIVFVNQEMYDDLAVIINSFYGGKLVGVKYAEISTVMIDRWGDCPNGGLDIFHRAVPDKTWGKVKWITRGQWWPANLSDAYIEYAFLDVHSLKVALQATDHLASKPVAEFCVVFPDKKMANRPDDLVITEYSLEDGLSVAASKPKYPPYFLSVCQSFAAKFTALLPCDSVDGVHYLFRWVYGVFLEDEANRKRDLAMGSCECDWDDLDGPSDPDRFKSTEAGLRAFFEKQLGVFEADPACDLYDPAALDRWLHGADEDAVIAKELAEGVDGGLVRCRMTSWRMRRAARILPARLC